MSEETSLRPAAKTPSRQLKDAPGDYVPGRRDFPGRRRLYWITIPATTAVILLMIYAVVLSGGSQSKSAVVGFFMFWLLIFAQQRFDLGRGRKYYQILAKKETANAEACVQAGLWIHEAAKTREVVEQGDNYYLQAIQRVPGHRDAMILLAASLLRTGRLRAAQPQAVVDMLEPWLTEHEDYMGEVLIAEALKDLGEHKRAVQHFRAALQILPNASARPKIEKYLRLHSGHPMA
jgi:hypothetical protein